jgi:uncharacterized protein (DUF488 family)
MTSVIHTIGHSNRKLDEFLALVVEYRITAVADVRSQPYSRVNPQFNREPLAKFLAQKGIAYRFLGRELGARTTDTDCYVNGRVQYERLGRTQLFQEGLTRIANGTQEHRIALLCAEKEPLACHRSILVARHLVRRGFRVVHIVDAKISEDHDASIQRLLSNLGMGSMSMFETKDELIELAYERQSARIAFELDEEQEPTRKRESA